MRPFSRDLLPSEPFPVSALAPHIEALYDAGGKVYEVGGAVRDRLLGLPVKDADLLVTGIPAKQLEAVLKKHGDVHLVGQSFGVLKFHPKGHTGEHAIDIALPRVERSTGAGHRDFDVSFDHTLPVETDLGRRDFTVNAIAIEMKQGTVIDPHGGRKDLAAKLLRMVFPRAFEEDPLRVLRGIQFAARLGFAVEPGTMAAMKQAAPLVATVSAERVTQELKKLLLAPAPSAGFYLMRDAGVLALVFPELHALIGVPQPGKEKVGDAFDHTLKVLDAARGDTALDNPGDPTLMLAALFHDLGKATTAKVEQNGRMTFHGHQFVSKKLARRRMEQLKIQQMGVSPDEILVLVENHMFDTGPEFTDKALRRFARKIGVPLVFKQIDLRIADNRGGAHPHNIRKPLNLRRRIREELDRKAPFGLKDLAINGHDLIERGYQPGPKIGEKLNELLELVLDDPSLNTRDELLKRI